MIERAVREVAILLDDICQAMDQLDDSEEQHLIFWKWCDKLKYHVPKVKL